MILVLQTILKSLPWTCGQIKKEKKNVVLVSRTSGKGRSPHKWSLRNEWIQERRRGKAIENKIKGQVSETSALQDTLMIYNFTLIFAETSALLKKSDRPLEKEIPFGNIFRIHAGSRWCTYNSSIQLLQLLPWHILRLLWLDRSSFAVFHCLGLS